MASVKTESVNFFGSTNFTHTLMLEKPHNQGRKAWHNVFNLPGSSYGTRDGALDFVRLEELFKFKPSYGKRENWISVKSEILSDNSFPNLITAKVMIADEILDATANTEHSDLSGYQTKVDINIVDNEIVESSSAEYLLKPRNRNKNNYFNADEDGKKRYYPYIAINEHLFMTFAKKELAFDVPYTGIVKAKDIDYHYVTKRYDRINGFKYN